MNFWVWYSLHVVIVTVFLIWFKYKHLDTDVTIGDIAVAIFVGLIPFGGFMFAIAYIAIMFWEVGSDIVVIRRKKWRR